MRLSEIPRKELNEDLFETDLDIKRCELALACGITQYSGGCVIERLEVNKRIKETITKEIARRVMDDLRRLYGSFR